MHVGLHAIQGTTERMEKMNANEHEIIQQRTESLRCLPVKVSGDKEKNDGENPMANKPGARVKVYQQS